MGYPEIQDYELIQKCGRGAYGDVFVAKSKAGNLVALKIIEKSSHAVKEFDGLKYYCSRCSDSPHLIKILHIGETEPYIYYTMELADNSGTVENYTPTTLDYVLKNKGVLNAKSVKILGVKLLEGLQSLHNTGLVHRDIKPENIIFVNGEPKLSDIGLVSSVSATFSLGGTVGFIPPEKLKSSSSVKSGKDDLYALGKLLYCSFTGNSPSKFPSIPKDIAKNEEYSNLNAVISSACHSNSMLRFQSIESFKKALENSVSRRRKIINVFWKSRWFWYTMTIVTVLILWRQKFNPTENEVPILPPMSTYITPQTVNFTIKAETSSGAVTSQEEKIYVPGNLDRSTRYLIPLIEDGFSPQIQWNKERFSIGDLNYKNGILEVSQGTQGTMTLAEPLPKEFSIRFQIDYSTLDGFIAFKFRQTNTRWFNTYQWILRKYKKFSSLEFEIAEGRQRTPANKYKIPTSTEFHNIEMVTTDIFVRFYIDGKLIASHPTIFSHGEFSIELDNHGEILLKDFEVFSIPKQVSGEYKLPLNTKK